MAARIVIPETIFAPSISFGDNSTEEIKAHAGCNNVCCFRKSSTILFGKRPGALARNSSKRPENNSTEVCLGKSLLLQVGASYPCAGRGGFLPDPPISQ